MEDGKCKYCKADGINRRDKGQVRSSKMRLLLKKRLKILNRP